MCEQQVCSSACSQNRKLFSIVGGAGSESLMHIIYGRVHRIGVQCPQVVSPLLKETLQ